MVSQADSMSIRSTVADPYPKKMNMRLFFFFFFSGSNRLLFPVSKETLPTDFPVS